MLDVTWIAKSDWYWLGKYFSASSFNIVVILIACFWETQNTKVLPISSVNGSRNAFWINALQKDKFVSSDLNFLSKSFLKNCCSSTSFPSASTPLKVNPSLLIISAERPVSTSTTVGLIKKPSLTPSSNEYLNVGSPSSHPKIE